MFFDALGLKWEYEPEGFELGGGVRYLPDFRFTKRRRYGVKEANKFIYVEVKPVAPSSAELYKAAALLSAAEYDTYLAFVVGTPGANYAEVLRLGGPMGVRRAYRAADFVRQGVYPPGASWESDHPNYGVWAVPNVILYNKGGELAFDVSGQEVPISESRVWRWAPLVDAVTAARSARFEFGEVPV